MDLWFGILYVSDEFSFLALGIQCLWVFATTDTFSFACFSKLTGDETEEHIDVKCTFPFKTRIAWYRFGCILFTEALYWTRYVHSGDLRNLFH